MYPRGTQKAVLKTMSQFHDQSLNILVQKLKRYRIKEKTKNPIFKQFFSTIRRVFGRNYEKSVRKRPLGFVSKYEKLIKLILSKEIFISKFFQTPYIQFSNHVQKIPSNNPWLFDRSLKAFIEILFQRN